MALLLELNITFTVFIVSVAVAILLLLLQRRAQLSSDALLGLLCSLYFGGGFGGFSLYDLGKFDFLFGDILAITSTDISIIWAGGLLVLVVLAYIGSRSLRQL